MLRRPTNLRAVAAADRQRGPVVAHDCGSSCRPSPSCRHARWWPCPTPCSKAYVGNYKIAASGYRRVLRAGSVLYTIRDCNPPLQIRPLSANEFFYEDGTASALRFELDANGKAIAMVFRRAGGQEERCPRE